MKTPGWRSWLWPTLAVLALLGACSRVPDSSFAGYAEGEYLYLAAPAGGYLDTLQASRGSHVAAGAPLFVIAAEPEQQGLRQAEAQQAAASERARNLSEPRRASEVAAAEAQLRAAEAALQLSSQQLEQQQALAAKGFVSAARLDEVRAANARDKAQADAARDQLATVRASIGRPAEVRSAQADAMAAAAQAAQRRWQLERKSVTAPAAGAVAETYYRAGEWVPAGAPVVSLLPDDRRRVRFFVPETAIAALRTGQALNVSCDGCAGPIRATIDFISPQAEYTPPVIYSRGSREKLVFRVEATPDPAQAGQLHPGLPVDVRLATP